MSLEQPSDHAEGDPRLIRLSHEDRDRMLEILRDAAADGRLDTEELEERVERALTARTFADLEPLTRDLPVAAPLPPPVRIPPSAPALAGDDEVVRVQTMGQRLVREGAWVVPRILEIDMLGSSTRLDYTLARLPEGGRSTVRLSTNGGSVRLKVPRDIAVDLSGLSTSGGRIRDHASRRTTPESVTHVITVTGSTYGGSVRVDPSDAG